VDLNSQLPILNGGWNSRNFSFQKLTGKALESFESYAMRPDSEPSRKIAETALKILEYVLRITGHKGINNTIQFASKEQFFPTDSMTIHQTTAAVWLPLL